MLAEGKAAGMSARTWLLAAPQEIPLVQRVLPEAILAAGIDYRHAPAPAELVSAGDSMLNSEYGLSNRQTHVSQAAGS